MSTQTRLDAYLAAELQILNGQEVRHGDKTYRMADLEMVQAEIKKLQQQLSRETSATNGTGFRHSRVNLNRY